MRLLIAAASAAAALSSPALAHEDGYGGGYAPAPAYAAYADDYPVYHRSTPGFTLAGARAGITVLGVNLDAGAGLRISAGEPSYGGHAHRRRVEGYAPPPPPEYAQPEYAQPMYAAPAYAPPAYPTYSYAPPCGCGW